MSVRARLAGRSPREVVDVARRHGAMYVDRAIAIAENQLTPTKAVPLSGGDTRFAVIVVNFSTTRYLRLMLATLSELDRLDLLRRIVVVDNASRDGGLAFLRTLAGIDRVELVELRHRSNHARGLRAGVRHLDRCEPTDDTADVLVFCDPDIVFRRPDALVELASCFTERDADLVGECRGDPADVPDIQASFFAVRRSVYARRDVAPIVYHGSPAAWHQASIARAGLSVVNFAVNRDGYLLHRGRAGVAAAGEHRPGHHYATVRTRDPHFMGVPNGERIWAEIERRHHHLVAEPSGAELVRRLSDRLPS